VRWALLTVLVVALVVVVFYAMRANAETPPAEPEPMTPTPTPTPMLNIVPPMREVTRTLERTAEEEWRARVMLAAQDYERVLSAYVEKFPTYEPGRRALYSARAIAAAAPMESRASLMFRIAFVSPPPTGAGLGRRAWDSLVAAIRAPIIFRPELAPVPTVTGIVPLGDLHL
jgi:hypothetical protein